MKGRAGAGNEKNMKIIATSILAGVLLFTGIVAYLQFQEPNYRPKTQYMSELASGECGQLMIVAFFALGATMTGAAVKFRFLGAPWPIQTLAAFAGLLFAGAGVVTLEMHALAHIVLVFCSFGLFVAGILAAPLIWPPARHLKYRIVTYGSAGLTLLSTAMSGYGVPEGLAQRGAAGGIMLWLIWFGLARFGPQRPVSGEP